MLHVHVCGACTSFYLCILCEYRILCEYLTVYTSMQNFNYRPATSLQLLGVSPSSLSLSALFSLITLFTTHITFFTLKITPILYYCFASMSDTVTARTALRVNETQLSCTLQPQKCCSHTPSELGYSPVIMWVCPQGVVDCYQLQTLASTL